MLLMLLDGGGSARRLSIGGIAFLLGQPDHLRQSLFVSLFLSVILWVSIVIVFEAVVFSLRTGPTTGLEVYGYL